MTIKQFINIIRPPIRDFIYDVGQKTQEGKINIIVEHNGVMFGFSLTIDDISISITRREFNYLSNIIDQIKMERNLKEKDKKISKIVELLKSK